MMKVNYPTLVDKVDSSVSDSQILEETDPMAEKSHD